MTFRKTAVCHASEVVLIVLTANTMSFLVGNGTYVCFALTASFHLIHTPARLDWYPNTYAHRGYHPTPYG